MELTKILAESGILALIIMIAGWLFIFKNSRALARQSEINSITASIEKLLQEIADENYKFWKDVHAGDDEKEHISKSKIFSAFIEYRCNIVEKKLHLLHEKCINCLNPEVEKYNFIPKSVEIIAGIRDRSTINSEQPKSISQKYTRISSINYLTLKLSSEANAFVTARYRPMSEWTWPENY